MRSARTFAEKVLGTRAGRDVRAGDIVVCEPDLVLGTDGSTPMAIDYFEAMGGGAVVRPHRVLLARDHYAPPTSPGTLGFHERMVAFSAEHGVEVLDVGDGIGFLVALERGLVRPGDLVIGGDSHTVSCGVAGAFAVGVGSSDLAAAFKTGKVWLRVPETVRVVLEGVLATGVGAKDLALELVRMLALTIGPFTAIEFVGPGADALPPEERIVLTNMSAEMGAMAGVFTSADGVAKADGAAPGGGAYATEPGAAVSAAHVVDVAALEPRVARPHDPANGVSITEVVGDAVDWVLLGTCTGGRAHDFREALRVLDRAGGLAPGVTLAVVPPTARVRDVLEADGTLAALVAHGALVGSTGCGPCCGTSGPLPPPGARVISTANRNFRARMGDSSISILLASPATCAASAAAGRVVDPRDFA